MPNFNDLKHTWDPSVMFCPPRDTQCYACKKAVPLPGFNFCQPCHEAYQRREDWRHAFHQPDVLGRPEKCDACFNGIYDDLYGVSYDCWRIFRRRSFDPYRVARTYAYARLCTACLGERSVRPALVMEHAIQWHRNIRVLGHLRGPLYSNMVAEVSQMLVELDF